MTWDGDNRFNDDMDDTVTLEASEDGEYVIIGVNADSGEGVGIALNAESAHALADLLHMLAAGL